MSSPGAERIEELHPDLVQYLGESEVLGAVLKAPLVFLVPYQPTLTAFANEMYRTKLDGLLDGSCCGRFRASLLAPGRGSS